MVLPILETLLNVFCCSLLRKLAKIYATSPELVVELKTTPSHCFAHPLPTEAQRLAQCLLIQNTRSMFFLGVTVGLPLLHLEIGPTFDDFPILSLLICSFYKNSS